MPSQPSQICFPPVESSEYEQVRDFAHQIWPRVYRDLISEAQIAYMMDLMYSQPRIAEEVKSHGIRYHWIENQKSRIGYLAFGPVRPATPATLHKLYLIPESHGKGFGSLALQWVIEKLESSGSSELNLRVNRENRAAILCYERAGFHKTEEDCLDIGNGFLMDDFLMSRPIHL